jgi:hypothetical protein
MGLAPSGYAQSLEKTVNGEVPVPIYSQLLTGAAGWTGRTCWK